MIIKFIDKDGSKEYIEFNKSLNYCIINTSTNREIFALEYQQIYDLIRTLNEIKKRIEREGKQ